MRFVVLGTGGAGGYFGAQTALMGFAMAQPSLLLADLPPWQIKSAPLGCGKSTRRANHF
jgi:hypothetical protein